MYVVFDDERLHDRIVVIVTVSVAERFEARPAVAVPPARLVRWQIVRRADEATVGLLRDSIHDDEQMIR
jgi:hypothetical protein